MDPSAEKMVRSTLRQLVLARTTVVGLSTIGVGLEAIGHGFNVVGAGVKMLGNTVFTMEADAARRYEQLTGVDLGLTIGIPNRYLGIHPGDEAPEREGAS